MFTSLTHAFFTPQSSPLRWVRRLLTQQQTDVHPVRLVTCERTQSWRIFLAYVSAIWGREWRKLFPTGHFTLLCVYLLIPRGTYSKQRVSGKFSKLCHNAQKAERSFLKLTSHCSGIHACTHQAATQTECHKLLKASKFVIYLQHRNSDCWMQFTYCS